MGTHKQGILGSFSGKSRHGGRQHLERALGNARFNNQKERQIRPGAIATAGKIFIDD